MMIELPQELKPMMVKDLSLSQVFALLALILN
jgi:hypothetical protein